MIPDFQLHQRWTLLISSTVRQHILTLIVVLLEHQSANWIHRDANYPSWDFFCVSLFCVVLRLFPVISPQSTIH